MTIGWAMQALSRLSVPMADEKSSTGSKVDFERAQRIALKSTAEMAKDFIVSHMQREWPNSGAGGEFPAKRGDSKDGGGPYGGLDKAIIARVGKIETGWDKKNKPVEKVTDTHTASVLVDPNAVDTSKGRRLQRYAKYLQTGWVLNTESKRKYFDIGRPGHVSKRKRAKGVAVPGKVQPPRPFLEQVILMNYQPDLVRHYRSVLKSNLPAEMKQMADKARLTVTFDPPTY